MQHKRRNSDKRRQAIWHHHRRSRRALLTSFSTRDAKALWGKHLERKEGGHGDNLPWCHKAALLTNTTRASWERCEYNDETHLATTIIVAGASIAATPVRWNKQEDIPQQEALNRSGKIKPLIFYDASIGIDKNDQQKTSSTNSAATMTRGTRITHATLTVCTMQASWLAVTGTPSLDNKTSASSNDTNSKIPCYFGGFPKVRGCLLFVLWPWPEQEKLRLFFRWSL